MTVTRRIRSPGRARNKPLKPLRAGMPGDLGASCGDSARVLTSPFAREAMGAAGTRHSARPLFFGAHGFGTARARHAAGSRTCVFPSLRGAKRPKQSSFCFVSAKLDCFAEPVIGRAFARPVGSQ